MWESRFGLFHIFHMSGISTALLTESDGVLCVGGERGESASAGGGGEDCGEGQVLFSQEPIRIATGVRRAEGRRRECRTVFGQPGDARRRAGGEGAEAV